LAGMEKIIKHQPEANVDAHIFAMWLRFLLAPSKPNPELGGFYNLGEIGTDANRNWTRATPYSPTEQEQSDPFCPPARMNE
jgi:hypothetical protein